MEEYTRIEANYAKILFTEVSNTKEVKESIFSAKLPLCLLKPKYIVDPLQLSMAITKAAFNEKEGLMHTRTFATEILYSLSPTKNITDSIRSFGTGNEDTEFILIGEESQLANINIKSSIKGREVPLVETLPSLVDIPLVKKTYKISEQELAISTLSDSILTRMSSKEFIL